MIFIRLMENNLMNYTDAESLLQTRYFPGATGNQLPEYKSQPNKTHRIKRKK